MFQAGCIILEQDAHVTTGIRLRRGLNSCGVQKDDCETKWGQEHADMFQWRNEPFWQVNDRSDTLWYVMIHQLQVCVKLDFEPYLLSELKWLCTRNGSEPHIKCSASKNQNQNGSLYWQIPSHFTPVQISAQIRLFWVKFPCPDKGYSIMW